jgi:hypothetical protein
MSADLAPSRRLHATDGQARSLFNELTRNIATRTKPDGGALGSIVERFVGEALQEAKKSNVKIEDVIQKRLAPLQELVSGFDFATVLQRYTHAYNEGNEEGKTAALRWLRAEFGTKTEARTALGVREIIDDARFYDYLKLYGAFMRLAGYGGLLVVLDEMVNLYKLTSAASRSANYEQILRILNDVLQGSASGMRQIAADVFQTMRGVNGLVEIGLSRGRRYCLAQLSLGSVRASGSFSWQSPNLVTGGAVARLVPAAAGIAEGATLLPS